FEFFRKSGRAHNHLLSEYYEAKTCLANPGRFKMLASSTWSILTPIIGFDLLTCKLYCIFQNLQLKKLNIEMYKYLLSVSLTLSKFK
ncbi:hypothetical protein DFR37_1401, partial [Eoetvoesiella caeni]